MLRREQAQGTVRGDIEPELAAISAVSLCVFPFVSMPVAQRVLGLSLQGDRVRTSRASHDSPVSRWRRAPSGDKRMRKICCWLLTASDSRRLRLT